MRAGLLHEGGGKDFCNPLGVPTLISASNESFPLEIEMVLCVGWGGWKENKLIPPFPGEHIHPLLWSHYSEFV